MQLLRHILSLVSFWTVLLACGAIMMVPVIAFQPKNVLAAIILIVMGMWFMVKMLTKFMGISSRLNDFIFLWSKPLEKHLQ